MLWRREGGEAGAEGGARLTQAIAETQKFHFRNVYKVLRSGYGIRVGTHIAVGIRASGNESVHV